jgi:hypothetical protein
LLASQVIQAIKSGRDPDAVTATYKSDSSLNGIDKALDRADAEKQSFWKFGETIKRYKQRVVVKKGVVQDRLSAASKKELDDRLRDRPEAAPLMERYVKELRIEDLEKVRDLIEAKRPGSSCPAKFVDLASVSCAWLENTGVS